MKALKEMDNLDRGELLIRLFPEEMENIQEAMRIQCNYLLQNEVSFRKGWHEAGFFTANFWYKLVHEANDRVNRSAKEWRKHPRWFSDCFFDGYNALFAMHCLIEYADKDKCNDKLKQAIHLLFGNEKFISIIIEKDTNDENDK